MGLTSDAKEAKPSPKRRDLPKGVCKQRVGLGSGGASGR